MDNPIQTSEETLKPGSRNLAYRYALVCDYKKHDKLIDYLKEELKKNDFKCLTIENEERDIILLSYNNDENLLKEAQLSKLRKTYTNKKIELENNEEDKQLDPRIIEQEQRKNYIVEYKNFYVPDSYYDINYDHILGDIKKNEDSKEKSEDWGYGLFTEAEMLYLETKILKKIKINKEKFIELALENTKLSKKKNVFEKFFSSNDDLISTYTYFKIISDQTPIHISNFKQNIMRETLFSLRCPYRKIRAYYGDKIAMYYAWFYHYTRWLIIPAMLSLFFIILNMFIPETSKINLTIYALFLSIWSQIFLIFFQRKCSEISVEWDNFTEEYDKDNERRQFKGEWRKSPITGKYEKYFPTSKRIPKYIFSIICALPMIIISIFANVCYLNLSGFIELNSLLEIKFIQNLTLPGKILDKNSIQNNLIGIIFGLVMSKINSLYEMIAEKTTDWENHKQQSNYENRLIIKRFIFEFFNYFLSPIYLAFIVFNMEGLRASMSNIRGAISSGNHLENMRGTKISKIDIIRQIDCDNYNDYSDYLSIVLEFGNLVLFAEYFPLAPIYLLIFNNIEMRIDIISLCNLYRRPMPIRKRNIGSWIYILFFISCIGIFTNLFFSLFIVEENKSLNILKLSANEEKVHSDANTLSYFFLLEHLVIIIIGLINYLFQTVSPWVKLYLERKDYKAKENKWKALLERFKIEKKINKTNEVQKTADDVETIKNMINNKLKN